LQATGGVTPYSWSITVGTLPAGLALNASTGVISGTPTASGSATFTVQVRDSAATPATATKQLGITIAAAPPALAISTTSLAIATAGSAYSATLQASGGVSPYSWSITVGSLPTGLTLTASTGAISGTPTISGSATFTVQVRDSAATPATATHQFTLTVSGLTITNLTLADAVVGTAYSATFVAANGTPPYSWTRTSGSLPSGLTLASGGTLSGTPTAAGAFTFTVQVTDATTATKAATFTLTVNAVLTITTATVPDASTGSSYQQVLTATGGTTPYTWSVTAGSLPPGLSLATNGTISGTPTTVGSYSFTVQVADAASATRTAAFTMAVNAPGTFQYVLGTTKYAYSTQAQPAKGASFTDSTYHTTIRRVTDSANESKQAYGTITEYPTWDPSSSDGKYLVFQTVVNPSSASGPYVLYDGQTFAYLGTLPMNDGNNANAELRWDRTGQHPHWLLYRIDGQYRYYDVDNKVDGLIHDFSKDFPQYSPWASGGGDGYLVQCHEYCTPAQNGRYSVWLISRSTGGDYRVFVYDRTTDTVLQPTKDVSVAPNGLHGVLLSPSGNYVVINYYYSGNGSGEYAGPHAYTRDFSQNFRTTSDIPHQNFGYTKQGSEVIINEDPGTDHLQMTVLSNQHTYQLYDDSLWGWPSLLIAYQSAHPGWSFMSTYEQGTGATWAGEGARGQLFAFELDETKCDQWYDTEPAAANGTNPHTCSGGPARIWRLSFSQNNYSGYFQQVNGQVNEAGTKMWFGANWRNANSRSDVYEIDLPATWASDLANLP
jgi:hypothetical protein